MRAVASAGGAGVVRLKYRVIEHAVYDSRSSEEYAA